MASESDNSTSGSRGESVGEGATLSIGAISRATDIPRETLRTWERRYGFPSPERNSAGHRVYDVATVEQLRLTSRALDAGHRPANVVGKSSEALKALLEATVSTTRESTPAAPEPVRSSSDEDWLESWIGYTENLDGHSLDLAFRLTWDELGGMNFLTQRVGPFLSAVGDAWAEGRLDILHEHFTSERLRDFLVSKWRPLGDLASGPRVLLSTLPGELHNLGLHMVSVVVSLAGCEPTFLGPNMPPEEIAKAADRNKCDSVLISVSAAYETRQSTRELTELRRVLDDDIRLVVGGSGDPGDIENTEHLSDLESLYDWATRRRSGRD